MSSPKQLLATLLVGGIGGLIAGVFVLPVLVRVNLFGTANLLNKLLPQTQTVITKVEEKPVFIPQPDYFSDAINKIEPRVVAIQSFSGGTLVRSGSGIVLTQDGLIGTLNSIVPPMLTVQVSANGKIYSGKVVFRNYANNLAIISIGESGLEVAGLKSELPALGQNLLVFAKTVSFGQDKPLVAEALVSQTDTDRGLFKITIPYDQFLFGSVLIDDTGSVLGLLDFRTQKPAIIKAKALEESLSSALTKSK